MSSDVPISEQIEGCEDGAKYLSDLNVYPSIPDRLRAAANTLRAADRWAKDNASLQIGHQPGTCSQCDLLRAIRGKP